MGPFFRRLGEPVDKELDAITSYRLVLYFLLLLTGWTVAMAAYGLVPFAWHEVLLSVGILIAACSATGYLFARWLDIPRNSESDYITALILTLILSPPSDMRGIGIIAAAGIIAMASKYMLVLSRRHIFNPAAFGAFTVAILFNYIPSWWVGTAVTAPIIIIGGLLILRKTKRFFLVSVFLAVYVVIFSVNLVSGSGDLLQSLKLSFTATPLLFFAFIMLTEPLTSPYSLGKMIPYAALVGVLYTASDLHLAPEEALLIGNVFAFALTRDRRYPLSFLKKIKEADGIYSYLFSGKGSMKFAAGQYLEWTLPAHHTDSRGNRRYLTISASPTENQLMISLKLPDKPSSFKRSLSSFKTGDKILVSHLSGDFTLPKDSAKKLAFIAGGVGITPFRSMIKYAIDSKKPYDAHLLYSANSIPELAFTSIFNKAEPLGIKTSYTITDLKQTLPSWDGHTGPVRAPLIKLVMPDYLERFFYVSGPYGFVQAVRVELEKLSVPARQIKLDYFPGYG